MIRNENNEFAQNIIKYIARLERQRRRYMDEHLSAYKLHGSMVMIVLVLDREPGSSQDHICEVLGLDKGNVARKCRRMEDLGFIRREQSQEDRRQNRIYLTENGRKLLPVICGLLSEWRGIVTEGISEYDQKALLTSLGHMMDNAEK